MSAARENVKLKGGMKCPICGKPVEPGREFAPFCSDRCRLIDLGNWVSEKYRIPEPTPPEGEQDQKEEDPSERR